MSAHATPAHIPPAAPAATPHVATATPSAAPEATPEAGAIQHETAEAVKEVAASHPTDAPHDKGEGGEEKAEAAAAPAHPVASAHPAHKLLFPKKEGDSLGKVTLDAAKGTWKLATLPITIPWQGVRLVTGTVYAIGGKFYDAGAWVGNGAKSFWNHDKFYIPTVTKAVGGAIAWPFVKTWQATKWTAGKVWDGTKWTGGKAWEGIKWPFKKIKGLFSKKPAAATPVAEDAPAVAETAPATHTPPAGEAPATADAHHTTPAPAETPAAVHHEAPPAPAAEVHTPPPPAHH